ncbi:biliverdin-producing heme oxygenase [Stenotrophomonas sp. HITSZ_GD]|uniref:biliverdin-producing heme oxygenase n=1 Tax=Stenotrophomonas sp. HITSZ_GD TaxID=3037248 RepID=UPI00240CF175|nr:biliverdin-producing heme oxygenase [Stenotrophomonas sp. HITSZ_GD]MDG2524571.1 biliverdin-producing heme oxygenase [Stenotrophomonas sp. HITSZ_GD]
MPAPLVLAVTSRAESLRRLTSTTHARLDQAIMAGGIFQDRARFARFLHVQHRFHTDIAPLYAREDLNAALPALATRARLAQVRADLHALGVEVPRVSGEVPAARMPLPTALGWLYVAEGSQLGAAVILKLAAALGLSASFGATHLAPAPAGVAAHWRHFTAALDAIELDATEEALVVAGARAAFTRVHAYVREAFA